MKELLNTSVFELTAENFSSLPLEVSNAEFLSQAFNLYR